MTIFHFVILFQLCNSAGCNTVPQFGDVAFNSKLACEQYKQQFISVANNNKFRYSAACQSPTDKTEITISNGLVIPRGAQ